MQPASFLQRSPSRLTLGTVQFGLNYGVANRTGRPSFEEICRMLIEAYDQGVDTLDTAAAYGESEQRLGQALRQTGLAARMRVVTKVEELPQELRQTEAAARIEATVRKSIELLGLERLELCLFHAQENLAYSEGLQALQKRGLVAAYGVSVSNPEGLRLAMARPGVRAIQLPSNLLDRRFTSSGLAHSAQASGIIVFSRSVYLQGLLLMEPKSVPEHLRPVLAHRRPLETIAAEAGMTLGELALRAMLSEQALDALVVGVDNCEQLRRNLALFAKGALPADVLAAIAATTVDPPSFLIDPSAWAARAAPALGN